MCSKSLRCGLTSPITDISTSWGKNDGVEYGCVEMQGWRKTMEDTHFATSKFCDDENLSFFAVYDGHGGSEVSRWLSVHLHRMVESFYRTSGGRIEEALTKAFLSVDDNLDTWCRNNEESGVAEQECLLEKLREMKERQICESSELASSTSSCSSSDFSGIDMGGRPSCSLGSSSQGRPSLRPSLSISPASPVPPRCEKKGLRPSLSEELIHCCNYRNGREYGWDVGSTACAAVVSRDRVYVANVGDSRCVLSRGGEAIDLSVDHKPNTPRERARIEAAGLDVEHGRVKGELNLSRALGDLRFKNNSRLCSTQQAVTAVPDVACVDLQSDHDFLVIASDGIFDVLSSQEVVDFVFERLVRSNENVLDVAEELVRQCIAPSSDGYQGGTGMDNSTVVIVNLRGEGVCGMSASHSTLLDCAKKRNLDSRCAFFENSNKRRSFSHPNVQAIPTMFRDRFSNFSAVGDVDMSED